MVTLDGRSSVIADEGMGGEASMVEVCEIRARRLAEMEIGSRAGGIACWDGSRGHR